MTNTGSSLAARRGASNELLQFFYQQGELKDFPPQTELFRQGEAINTICLIESGLVKLTHTSGQGSVMTVALRFPGTMLGAASVISGNPAPTFAVTVETCRLYCLPAEIFLQQLKTNIKFANEVVRAISQNFYEQTLHQARLGTLRTPGRVAQLLLQFLPRAVLEQNGEMRLQLPISDSDAARLLMISPEHFSRTLKQLKTRDIIRRSKGWIFISDLEALRREAE